MSELNQLLAPSTKTDSSPRTANNTADIALDSEKQNISHDNNTCKLSSGNNTIGEAKANSYLNDHASDYENRESIAKICIVPLTNSVKSLFYMMIIFSIMTVIQYFAAVAINSNALKADCIGMGVDALSYFGNIIGECADIPERRIVTQLFFSLLSISLLVGFNTLFMIDVLQSLFPETFPSSKKEEDDGVVGWVVILFGVLNLVLDCLALWIYYYYAKKDAIVKQEIEAKSRGRHLDVTTSAQIEKPKVNMFSALLHTSADLIRTLSELIEGFIFMTNPSISPIQQERIDNIMALTICTSIYCGGFYGLYEWITEYRKWYLS